MPTQKQVLQMANALHERKLINLESSARDLISVESDILNGPEQVGWYVVAGTSYVLIGASTALEAIKNPAILENRPMR
jgi:hypothetical protein